MELRDEEGSGLDLLKFSDVLDYLGIDDTVARKRVRNIFNPSKTECLAHPEIVEILEKLLNEKEACTMMLVAVSIACGLLIFLMLLCLFHLMR